MSGKGIGGHQSPAAGTVEWLVDPTIIEKTGPYDLDPCAPIEQPYRTAARTFTIVDDGLSRAWPKRDRVWLNAPYDAVEAWLRRLADHGRGTAIIFARTDTAAFHRQVFERATALLWMEGRTFFRVGEAFSVVKTRKTYLAGDRAAGNAGGPTVLCAYGMADADVLAGCGIPGRFDALRVPRSVLVSFFATDKSGGKIDMTWREALDAFFGDRADDVGLDELYRYARGLPMAATNRNPEAKIRQTLARAGYDRVGGGKWRRPK